jgi:DNA-binding MarR family transcriptional regulator
MHPVVFGIKRAYLTSTNFLRRQLRRHFGLTQARFDILYLVHEGHEAQMEVRRLLGVTSSTISEALQTLERLGLVTRHPHHTDGRARRIALTAEGRKRTAACIEQWVTHRAGLRMVRNIFDWKSDPAEAFHRIEDCVGYLCWIQRWFSGSALYLYPEWHPDD